MRTRLQAQDHDRPVGLDAFLTGPVLRSTPMNIIWSIALGAIVGAAWSLGRTRRSIDVVPISLGAAGGAVGGVLASMILGLDPVDHPFDLAPILAAIVGAVVALILGSLVTSLRAGGRNVM